jgi:hypothetical protein
MPCISCCRANVLMEGAAVGLSCADNEEAYRKTEIKNVILLQVDTFALLQNFIHSKY